MDVGLPPGNSFLEKVGTAEKLLKTRTVTGAY